MIVPTEISFVKQVRQPVARHTGISGYIRVNGSYFRRRIMESNLERYKSPPSKTYLLLTFKSKPLRSSINPSNPKSLDNTDNRHGISPRLKFLSLTYLLPHPSLTPKILPLPLRSPDFSPRRRKDIRSPHSRQCPLSHAINPI
jgi:hypothetical protein